MLYKPLSSTSFLIDEEAKISNMIALPKKEKLFLVDQEHGIFSYSLDEHFILKQLAPKTNFAGINKKITTLALAATEEEEDIYFITPEQYYIFSVESLGLEMYISLNGVSMVNLFLGTLKMFKRLLYIENF